MQDHQTSLSAAELAASDTPRPQACRAAILDAAVRVFLRQGYEGTSMDLVAREAGVARRTVYNQFAGKEALFAATIEQVWTETRSHIRADDIGSGDPAADLRQLARRILGFWSLPTSVAFLRMVIGEYSRFPELAERFFTVGKEPACRALAAYMQRLSAAGVLSIPDPVLAATQFLALLKEPLVWPCVMGLTPAPPQDDFDRVIDSAVGMFLAYYGADKDS